MAAPDDHASTAEQTRVRHNIWATRSSARRCRAVALSATAYAVFGLVATMVEATRGADVIILTTTALSTNPSGHTMTWLVLWALTTLAAVATAVGAAVCATLLGRTATLLEPTPPPDGVDDYR